MKSASVEYCKDRNAVVCYWSTFLSAATVASSSWQRRSYASHRRVCDLGIYIDADVSMRSHCDEDRFFLLRRTATAADRPPV